MRSMGDEWRAMMRTGRKRMGFTLPEVAERAGLSYEAVRGYENGRRRPTREHLLRVLGAMQANQAEVNEILLGAGFAPELTLFPEDRYPSYYFAADELDAAVGTVPWPQFVVNNTLEVMAANRAMQAGWDVDFEAERRWRTRAQMNVLSVASDHHFADRVANWDEVIGFMCAIYKGASWGGESIEDPGPLFNEVLAEFAKADEAFLTPLLAAWTSAQPLPTKARQQYRVTWVDREFGEMRFLAQITTCSEPDGFAFNDWHPLDAETWTVLERVKARAAAG